MTVSGVRVDLVAPGRYRIDATDRGPMRLTVFEGHGTVRSANDAVGVAASQAVVVQPGGGVNFEQPTTTGFDQWALNRDEQYSQVRSAQYVSPYMTGYEELDTYGDWVARCDLRDRLVSPRRAQWLGAVPRTGNGAGCARGAGPGSTRRRGAMRPSTMAAG